jgi:hypothetical protein
LLYHGAQPIHSAPSRFSPTGKKAFMLCKAQSSLKCLRCVRFSQNIV